MRKEQKLGVTIISVQEFVEEMRTLLSDRYKVILGACRGGDANLIAVVHDRVALGENLKDDTTVGWHVLAFAASTSEREFSVAPAHIRPQSARRRSVQTAFVRLLDELPPRVFLTGDFNAMVSQGRRLSSRTHSRNPSGLVRDPEQGHRSPQTRSILRRGLPTCRRQMSHRPGRRSVRGSAECPRARLAVGPASPDPRNAPHQSSDRRSGNRARSRATGGTRAARGTRELAGGPHPPPLQGARRTSPPSLERA
ncbi:hypothetical protein N9L68_00620 [bacterium]|nr:hypothetical protein [bacterium]